MQPHRLPSSLQFPLVRKSRKQSADKLPWKAPLKAVHFDNISPILSTLKNECLEKRCRIFPEIQKRPDPGAHTRPLPG